MEFLGFIDMKPSTRGIVGLCNDSTQRNSSFLFLRARNFIPIEIGTRGDALAQRFDGTGFHCNGDQSTVVEISSIIDCFAVG